MKGKYNVKSGISLIVLIITIIVIAIIAGSVIISFLQNNIIENAKEAVNANNEATAKEEESLSTLNSYIKKLLNKKTEINIETTELGIGGCGMLFSPKISPFDSNTMAVLCDMGGFYISYNKGASWERRNLNGTCHSVYFDEMQEGVIYVGGSGLYKSVDNGKSFELIFPKKDTIIGTPHKYEVGMRYYFTTDGYPTTKIVKSILVDPKDSNHVYILMYYYQNGTIFESKDGGQSFVSITNYTKTRVASNEIYDYNELLNYENGNLIYVTQDGFYKYNSEKSEPEELYRSGSEIVDATKVIENNTTYYVFIEKEQVTNATTTVKYTSDFTDRVDLTQNIITAVNDTTNPFTVQHGNYGDIAFNWNFKHIEATSLSNIYLTQGSYSTNSSYPYGIEGVIKYNGSSSTWLYGNPFKTKGTLQNPAWGADDSYSMYGITVDKNNDNAVLFTTLCGVYYSPNSIDMYQKYSNVYGEGENKKYSTTGINVQNTHGVEHDPFDKNHIMLLHTDLGLITSYDNGETWTRAKEGINPNWLNSVYDVEFDKYNEGVVYSLWSIRQNAPYDVYGNETDYRYGGLAISIDGGKTWDSNYSSGLPEHVTPVKMSVVYNEGTDVRTIYVATFNEGFFVSYDSGENFIAMNDGIETVTYTKDANTTYEYIFGADIEVTEDGRIFGLTARSNCNYIEERGKVYEWIGEEKKWKKIELLENTTCPRDLYYKNGVLYISATAKYINDNKTQGVQFSNYGGGIYTYKDGNVEQIFDETISIGGVQIDSKGNMYASDIFGNIYLKNDEYDFENILSNYYFVSKGISLYNDDTLYLSTFGGGMLRIKISYSE